MPKHVWNTKKESTDLNISQCGMEYCEPMHSYGPAVRDHFLVHYILEGKGTFQAGGRLHSLKKGQGFLICPGAVTYYEADGEEPWTYAWVGFEGIKAEHYLKSAGLEEGSPVFSYPDADSMGGIIKEMLAVSMTDTHGELVALSRLYAFLALLVEAGGGSAGMAGQDRAELYLKKTVEYIEKNYARRIAVGDVAQAIGLDRSYLGSLFKKGAGMTMKEFLTAFRMNRACELLEESRLAVGDVARSVGYDDPLLFSKTFKHSKGASPTAYRGTSRYR